MVKGIQNANEDVLLGPCPVTDKPIDFPVHPSLRKMTQQLVTDICFFLKILRQSLKQLYIDQEPLHGVAPHEDEHTSSIVHAGSFYETVSTAAIQ